MKGQRRRAGRRTREADENRGSGEMLEDFQMAAVVQSALMAAAPSTGLRVDVDAEEGILYLRGEVASEWQRSEAERIAREMELPGVKAVCNELTVNPLLPPLPHP